MEAACGLNTVAAETFLLGIPLKSLSEEVSRLAGRKPHRDREPGISSDRLGKLGSAAAAGRSHEDGGHLFKILSLDSDELELVCLDTARAEEFLTSLVADEVFVGGAQTGGSKKSGERQSDSEDDLAQAEPRKPEKLITMVGGWRTRTDLDRLKPGIVKKGLLGGRIIVSARQSSVYISSVQSNVAELPGQLDQLQGRLKKQKSSGRFWQPGGRFDAMVRRVEKLRHGSTKKVGTSYAAYLSPMSEGVSYDPFFLDDRSLRQGKHHTVLRLEAYHVSLIPFVRPRRLKEELNDQFRQSHPSIHYSMTLSKLRNLQKDLRNIVLEVKQLEISTVATAWVYFEKLVLGDYVRKQNRKLLAGACLVLAFKFNQQFDADTLTQLYRCIRRLDRKDQLDQSALRDAEVKVFVWLEFGLHLPRSSIAPHMTRILSELGLSFTEYFGQDYTRLLRQEWRASGCGACDELIMDDDDFPVGPVSNVLRSDDPQME